MGNASNTVVKSENAVKLGVLGAGQSLQRGLYPATLKSPNMEITALASKRGRDIAVLSGKRYVCPAASFYDKYEDVLEDKFVDAVLITLPPSVHFQWIKKAIELNKHVLVQSPLASNELETAALQKLLLRKRDLVLMDGMSYRYHPSNIRMLEKVRSVFEEEKIKRMSFYQSVSFMLLPQSMDKDIRFQYNLSGGAMMHLGCSGIDVLRRICQMFNDDIVEVQSAAPRLHPSDKQIDVAMSAVFRLKNGGEAELNVMYENTFKTESGLKCQFEDGRAFLYDNLFNPHIYNSLTLLGKDEKAFSDSFYEKDKIPPSIYEIETFVQKIQNKSKVESNIGNTVKNMHLIDQVYKKAGMTPRGV